MPIFGSCSGCCSDYPPSHSRHNLRLTPRSANLGAAGFADLRLASISTFVDSRRGPQCALAELLERLARTYHCDIHPFCPARRGSRCCSSEFSAFARIRRHPLAQNPIMLSALSNSEYVQNASLSSVSPTDIGLHVPSYIMDGFGNLSGGKRAPSK